MSAAFTALAEHVEGETPAEKHERMALHYAQFFDRVSVTRAAAHFAVAAELRTRAKA